MGAIKYGPHGWDLSTFSLERGCIFLVCNLTPLGSIGGGFNGLPQTLVFVTPAFIFCLASSGEGGKSFFLFLQWVFLLGRTREFFFDGRVAARRARGLCNQHTPRVKCFDTAFLPLTRTIAFLSEWIQWIPVAPLCTITWPN